jgi:SecD/SecF fusion protein
MLSAVPRSTAMVLFATINMNYGIDFKGGSMIEVQAKEGNADVADIRARCPSSISAMSRCRSLAHRARC